MAETFLSSNECSVGYIGNASGITLVIPRGRYDPSAIIVPSGEKLTAIFLEGHDPFSAIDCTGSDAWQGVLVPNVDIEFDVDSVFDPHESSELIGSVVRKADTLGIVAKLREDRFGSTTIPIIRGLPAGDQKLKAGFKVWSIKIGDGINRRTLKTIRVGQVAAKT